MSKGSALCKLPASGALCLGTGFLLLRSKAVLPLAIAESLIHPTLSGCSLAFDHPRLGGSLGAGEPPPHSTGQQSQPPPAGRGHLGGCIPQSAPPHPPLMSCSHPQTWHKVCRGRVAACGSPTQGLRLGLQLGAHGQAGRQAGRQKPRICGLAMGGGTNTGT